MLRSRMRCRKSGAVFLAAALGGRIQLLHQREQGAAAFAQPEEDVGGVQRVEGAAGVGEPAFEHRQREVSVARGRSGRRRRRPARRRRDPPVACARRASAGAACLRSMAQPSAAHQRIGLVRVVQRRDELGQVLRLALGGQVGQVHHALEGHRARRARGFVAFQRRAFGDEAVVLDRHHAAVSARRASARASSRWAGSLTRLRTLSGSAARS